MTKIVAFEVHAMDLPFRKAFKHAAAERLTSDSLFVECITDDGTRGFGECLPRSYVTGESRDAAFEVLCDVILPNLVGREFSSMAEVHEFLTVCDGKSPGWLSPERPQTAAWCAVDLALLDTFGKCFDETALSQSAQALPDSFRYSGVLSADKGLKLIKSALKQRVYGLKQVKLKVETP